jgi:hypothetical protein
VCGLGVPKINPNLSLPWVLFFIDWVKVNSDGAVTPIMLVGELFENATGRLC